MASPFPEKLLLAAPRGYCAGVDRAVQSVERALELHGAPVYVRKEIVHNKHVVEQLRARGAVFVEELDDSIPEGAVTVFSAHGVSPAVHAEAAERGLQTIDATCPLVTKVHREAVKFAAEGYTIVLIGHAGHEEVEGTTGEAPENIVLVQTEDDVDALELHGPPVYVRKEIVHNKHVVASLRERGAIFVDELEDSIPEGAITVFSAHGVSPAAMPTPSGAACGPSTRPARWSPRSTARRSSSPPRASRSC